jgi:hypothetical protein
MVRGFNDSNYPVVRTRILSPGVTADGVGVVWQSLHVHMIARRSLGLSPKPIKYSDSAEPAQISSIFAFARLPSAPELRLGTDCESENWSSKVIHKSVVLFAIL